MFLSLCMTTPKIVNTFNYMFDPLFEDLRNENKAMKVKEYQEVCLSFYFLFCLGLFNSLSLSLSLSFFLYLSLSLNVFLSLSLSHTLTFDYMVALPMYASLYIQFITNSKIMNTFNYMFDPHFEGLRNENTAMKIRE